MFAFPPPRPKLLKCVCLCSRGEGKTRRRSVSFRRRRCTNSICQNRLSWNRKCLRGPQMVTVFPSLAAQFPGEFQQIACACARRSVWLSFATGASLFRGKTNLREVRRRCRRLLPGSLGLVEPGGCFPLPTIVASSGRNGAADLSRFALFADTKRLLFKI